MSKDKGESKVAVMITVAVIVGLVLCGAAACVDSCKRLNRPCFGNSQQQ